METKVLNDMGITPKELNELYVQRVYRELCKTFPSDFIDWYISKEDLKSVCLVNRNLVQCVANLSESMTQVSSKPSPVSEWIKTQFESLDFRCTRTYTLDPTKEDHTELKKQIKKRHRGADLVDIETAKPGEPMCLYNLKKAVKIKLFGFKNIPALFNILQYLYGPDKIVMSSQGLNFDQAGKISFGALSVVGIKSSKSYYLQGESQGIHVFKCELIKFLRSRRNCSAIIY